MKVSCTGFADEQYTSEAGLREQHPEESNVHEGPFGRQLVPREISTGQAAGHDVKLWARYHALGDDDVPLRSSTGWRSSREIVSSQI